MDFRLTASAVKKLAPLMLFAQLMIPRIYFYVAATGLILTASPAFAVDPPVSSFDPVGTIYNEGAGLIQFPGSIEVKDLDLTPTAPIVMLPPPGSPAQDFPAMSFFDVFAEISLDGGVTFTPMTGTAEIDEHITLPSSSTPGETFDTQITALDLDATLPGHTVMMGLDPANLPSDTGMTTVTNMGGGQFRIDSFFDIFTDISIDGGPIMPQQNTGSGPGGSTPITLASTPDSGSTALLLGVPVALVILARRRGFANG